MELDQTPMTIIPPRQIRYGVDHGFASFFFRGVEVVGKQLVHGEHVDFVLLEYRIHGIVASDLTLVVGVLQITLLDISPDLLYCLRTR